MTLLDIGIALSLAFGTLLIYELVKYFTRKSTSAYNQYTIFMREELEREALQPKAEEHGRGPQ